MPVTVRVVLFCLALTSTLTACTAEPGSAPSESPTTRSAAPAAESPSPRMSDPAPPPLTASFSGVEFDVAFSFDYPAAWTVARTAQSNQEGVPFTISDEAGRRVAFLYVQPQLTAYPCEEVCGEVAVSYLGEAPGQGMLGNKPYSVQTKAMDLTSRRDLQEANRWQGNVRLTVGVVGIPSTTPAEDPVHFTTGAGVDVPSSSSPVRPILFAADRYFETMTEAKAYTSSKEYIQVQAMLRSLKAAVVIGADPLSPGRQG